MYTAGNMHRHCAHLQKSHPKKLLTAEYAPPRTPSSRNISSDYVQCTFSHAFVTWHIERAMPKSLMNQKVVIWQTSLPAHRCVSAYE